MSMQVDLVCCIHFRFDNCKDLGIFLVDRIAGLVFLAALESWGVGYTHFPSIEVLFRYQ